jgi:hypothetical protein
MQRKMHMKISSSNIFSDKIFFKKEKELNMLALQLTDIVTKVKDLN